MNCLSIIAELKRCSVAVSYGKKLFSVNENLDSSSQLAWITDQLLRKNGMEYESVQKIITISGPGSFTGIRVAQSLCKGLSLALKIPGVCVSYFDLLALEFHNMLQKYPSLIVIKSEKNQYYYQYQNQTGIDIPENFAKIIEGQFIVIGEQAKVIGDIIGSRCIQCVDYSGFRDASKLLPYAEKIFAPIKPLYINAQKKL